MTHTALFMIPKVMEGVRHPGPGCLGTGMFAEMWGDGTLLGAGPAALWRAADLGRLVAMWTSRLHHRASIIRR